MVVVLLWATGVAGYLGSAVVARHRAQAVADLAALAAAACIQAAAVARAMRVDDIGCVVDGLDVVITARVPVVVAGTARATARAGPAAGRNG